MANEQEENGMESRRFEDDKQNALSSASVGGIFEIHVKGHLNSQWSDWLEGLEVKLLDDGEMILLGYIIDQSALMGVLNKLNRLNLALLSVIKVDRN
jgi:hypothetical protein